MASIKIIAIPAGEAPQSVREAWVGLVLPLASATPHRMRAAGQGVLTGPKSRLGSLLRGLINPHIVEGYAVEALQAFEVLARYRPSAAQWWQENTPHLFRPGTRLMFHAEACEELPED